MFPIVHTESIGRQLLYYLQCNLRAGLPRAFYDNAVKQIKAKWPGIDTSEYVSPEGGVSYGLQYPYRYKEDGASWVVFSTYDGWVWRRFSFSDEPLRDPPKLPRGARLRCHKCEAFVSGVESKCGRCGYKPPLYSNWQQRFFSEQRAARFCREVNGVPNYNDNASTGGSFALGCVSTTESIINALHDMEP